MAINPGGKPTAKATLALALGLAHILAEINGHAA